MRGIIAVSLEMASVQEISQLVESNGGVGLDCRAKGRETTAIVCRVNFFVHGRQDHLHRLFTSSLTGRFQPAACSLEASKPQLRLADP
jgi:hypothetical protein